MKFVRGVWKLLVGIKDLMVLIFMLLFFSLLYAGLKSSPKPLGEGILLVDLDGSLVEQPSLPSTAEILSGSASRIREHRLSEIVQSLDAARGDPRIKAVAFDLDGFLGGGQTAIATLGEAMDRVRRSGKPVVTFATAYTDDRYQLAAHSSEVWLSPMGAVAVAGPGGTNLYFKGLFDKLGVTAHIYRVGTYKAAVEPFERTGMSPEARENAQALAGALLETWRQDVTKARPKASAGLTRYLANPVAVAAGAGGDLARAAMQVGLVDRLGERHQFEARLAELGGDDRRLPGGFKRVAVRDYAHRTAPPGGPIGVVTVAGTIVDGTAGPGTAAGETIARAIEKAVANDAIKALIVRIDSPGGSVTASERIRQAILAAKAKGIPVVASMGNVAASGGYWVATPANVIFAEPSTITGSIGVFGILPSFEGSLAKLGITTDGVKTSPLSGEPDLLAGPSPVADALLQTGVESTYRRFLAIVAQSRKKSPAEIDRIAQGRVWDGGTARQIGLVDRFGGLDDAIEAAAAAAKLGDERGVTLLEAGPTLTSQLLGMVQGEPRDDSEAPDAWSSLAPAPKTLLAEAMARLEAVLDGPAIQATCLECPAVAPANLGRTTPPTASAWARVAAWLAG
ncbi:signal peptide peptidase SppA [Sphingomonas rhizophila]|uniref:Signal peptide peptidase SppA n=1 Tax=Sphingomonas rhizophila TaxID=2071607 RepID=A0A7G9S991_9SPHN|nr:signal peptide peptidase SppA [Sphingomonas rhizophila]QNN64416.1 signal peptide peptidase SppA [Sphingomonas rhizophila]